MCNFKAKSANSCLFFFPEAKVELTCNMMIDLGICKIHYISWSLALFCTLYWTQCEEPMLMMDLIDATTQCNGQTMKLPVHMVEVNYAATLEKFVALEDKTAWSYGVFLKHWNLPSPPAHACRLGLAVLGNTLQKQTLPKKTWRFQSNPIQATLYI